MQVKQLYSGPYDNVDDTPAFEPAANNGTGHSHLLTNVCWWFRT